MPEWKDTVNLPRTGFPMKANLQTAEPEALARWEAMDLYGRIRARRKGAPKFVLHDGPPYANAQIHLGTALNKILKDFVVKSKTMAGLRRAVRAGLRLSRTADRAAGGSRARAEEAPDVARRPPSRLPRLCGALHRRDDERVQASDGVRPMGSAVRHDGLSVSGRHRTGAWDASSSAASSTRERSRSTGVSTAAQRWPRRRWNTKITRLHRSTSNFR